MPGPTFPFDFRPDSGFSVSTGNFTVPADVYVQASCVSSTTALVVDGTTILLGMDAPDVDAEGSWNINSGETSLHTNTTGQSQEITVMIENTNGTGIIKVDDGAGDYTIFDTGVEGLLTYTFFLPDSATIDADHVSGNPYTGEFTISGKTIQAREISSHIFWAPTGTTINGGRKAIAEYNE